MTWNLFWGMISRGEGGAPRLPLDRSWPIVFGRFSAFLLEVRKKQDNLQVSQHKPSTADLEYDPSQDLNWEYHIKAIDAEHEAWLKRYKPGTESTWGINRNYGGVIEALQKISELASCPRWKVKELTSLRRFHEALKNPINNLDNASVYSQKKVSMTSGKRSPSDTREHPALDTLMEHFEQRIAYLEQEIQRPKSYHIDQLMQQRTQGHERGN